MYDSDMFVWPSFDRMPRFFLFYFFEKTHDPKKQVNTSPTHTTVFLCISSPLPPVAFKNSPFPTHTDTHTHAHMCTHTDTRMHTASGLLLQEKLSIQDLPGRTFEVHICYILLINCAVFASVCIVDSAYPQSFVVVLPCAF